MRRHGPEAFQSAAPTRSTPHALIIRNQARRVRAEPELLSQKCNPAIDATLVFGSQELQGEVLELDIQAALEQQFPLDRIEPVVKGARGADIVQRVRNERLDDCGAIVWETKNTKNWQPAWIDRPPPPNPCASATTPTACAR